MTPKTRIFLVGPMGAGKTTIGRQLAKQLGLRFVDSDQSIESRTGASIPLIFDIEGEAGFRRREKTAIAELTLEEGIVLATGGGAVLDPDNRSYLRQRGFVVYLTAPLDTLVERTTHDRNRPLLQTDNPRERLESLMTQRDPLYREIAQLVIDTADAPLRNVLQQIIDAAKKAASSD